MITSSGNMMRKLPLFPLPDFFLFPGAVAPLHIFEPRYRQMVTDLLDTSGRIVLAAYRPTGPRTRSGPAVMPVAGLGEIVHHETLADGRFLIWVMGLGRVMVSEVPSDRLYRKTNARLVPDRYASEHADLSWRRRTHHDVRATALPANRPSPAPARRSRGWSSQVKICPLLKWRRSIWSILRRCRSRRGKGSGSRRRVGRRWRRGTLRA